MSYAAPEIWAIIAAIGLGTYVMRFSFLGLIGDRSLPPLILRLLRYTPVAVIPGLVAPLIVSPDTGADPARVAAAVATVAVGWWSRSLLGAFVAGIAIYAAVRYVSGS